MTSADQDIGRTVRRLMRRCTSVGLGTLECQGGPTYVSLAMVALDQDATPLLYLSDLADHTRNLSTDPRLSLLFDGTLASAVPLAGERATIQGRAERTSDRRLLGRYVARHPDAADYAGFRDFNLYRVSIERAHLVAGFGRIHWVPGDRVKLEEGRSETLLQSEREVIEHMNNDHADAVQLYAGRILGRAGSGWIMTGLDPEGCDLRRGAEVARLPFENEVHDTESARIELIRLVRRARSET